MRQVHRFNEWTLQFQHNKAALHVALFNPITYDTAQENETFSKMHSQVDNTRNDNQ